MNFYFLPPESDLIFLSFFLYFIFPQCIQRCQANFLKAPQTMCAEKWRTHGHVTRSAAGSRVFIDVVYRTISQFYLLRIIKVCD